MQHSRGDGGAASVHSFTKKKGQDRGQTSKFDLIKETVD